MTIVEFLNFTLGAGMWIPQIPGYPFISIGGAVACNVHGKSAELHGTIKNAVKLFDGFVVESVLIPSSNRSTACVSSQVGCSLNCEFCATSKLKRMRNLNPDEIYDQVVTIDRQSQNFYNRPLTNIVFMGMGEPLMNYNNRGIPKEYNVIYGH